MILVLLVIFAALSIICYLKQFSFLKDVFFILTGASLIIVFFLIYEVGFSKVIDNKIALYEEENQRIEEQISAIVEEYLGYEKETYESVKLANSPLIIETMYPELKGSEIVKEEIQLYIQNYKHVIDLKEEKADLPRVKWMLYFGV